MRQTFYSLQKCFISAHLVPAVCEAVRMSSFVPGLNEGLRLWGVHIRWGLAVGGSERIHPRQNKRERSLSSTPQGSGGQGSGGEAFCCKAGVRMECGSVGISTVPGCE